VREDRRLLGAEGRHGRNSPPSSKSGLAFNPGARRGRFHRAPRGVPVGRIVYSFGAANGVPEGDAIGEEALTAIAEAWFAASA
jgi:hypothetical protein